MAVSLLQDTRFAISFKKQANLETATTAADMVSLQLENDDPIGIEPINEDNAEDKGKGVYATNVYPSHINTSGNWNGKMTAHAMAIMSAFWAGAVVKAAAGSGWKYTIVAPNLTTQGLELPSASALVKIGGVRDLLLRGIICNSFGFNFTSGPGRENAKFESAWVGTGGHTRPSGLTMPWAYAEASLNAGGITALTLVGFDYIANKRFSSVNAQFNNQLRDESGFYPGSGSQSGYQLRGCMRRGAPQLSLSAVVEADSGTSEEDALVAQTEGTGVITCSGGVIGAGPEVNEFKITYHRLRVRRSPITGADGIAAWGLEYSILEHVTNGVFTIEATCDLNNILTAAV